MVANYEECWRVFENSGIFTHNGEKYGELQIIWLQLWVNGVYDVN